LARRVGPLGEFFVEEDQFPHVLIEKLVSELHDHNEQAILDTPLLRRFIGIFFRVPQKIAFLSNSYVRFKF